MTSKDFDEVFGTNDYGGGYMSFTSFVDEQETVIQFRLRERKWSDPNPFFSVNIPVAQIESMSEDEVRAFIDRLVVEHLLTGGA